MNAANAILHCPAKKALKSLSLVGRASSRAGLPDNFAAKKPASNRLISSLLSFFRSPLCFLCSLLFTFSAFAAEPTLKPASFSHYIEHFNAMEDENITNFVSNADSWNWLIKEIPFFECPDREVEEMYYFRWWYFRKHLVQTLRRILSSQLVPLSEQLVTLVPGEQWQLCNRLLRVFHDAFQQPLQVPGHPLNRRALEQPVVRCAEIDLGADGIALRGIRPEPPRHALADDD